MNFLWRRFLFGRCHVFRQQIKSALGRSHHINSKKVWGRVNWFPKTFPNPGWVLDSSLWAGDNETSYLQSANVVSSRGKGIASDLCDAKVFIDYLQKSHAINGAYYASFLRQFRMFMTTKHPGNWRIVSCSIRIMLQRTRISIQWLLCKTVVWKLLISFPILLIYFLLNINL